jgi:ribose transport system ATP-binding protein
MHEVSLRSIADYSIKTTGFDQRVGRLSGGNKQKVNLARWMLRDIDVLVLDCPTRGVDIGVKAYIYAMINESRKKGLAILLISDELPEVIGMSDRILVLKNGKSAGIFERGAGFTEEKIIEVMI